MNYSQLFNNFTKELKSVCQYKHIDNPFRIFAAIALLPFWISCFSIICSKYVCLFVFNCVASAADYLEGWVKETVKEVNTWTTQAVVYLITTPFIFFLRCFFSIFGIVFFLLWFSSNCIGYIASLAGISWYPFIASAKYEDNVVIKPTTNKIAANIIIIISFVLFCITTMLFVLQYEMYELYLSFQIFYCIYALFAIIAIPIAFRHKKVVLCNEEISEAANEQVIESPVAKAPAETTFEEEFPDF